jgi:hypothetical protein
LPIGWPGGEIRNSSRFKELDTNQQEIVKRREKETLQEAQTAVKNAYEIVIYLHSDGTTQTRKSPSEPSL